MNQQINHIMKTGSLTPSRPYTAPSCRVRGVQFENNFLVSGDYGNGGYPGSDLGDGGEYEF